MNDDEARAHGEKIHAELSTEVAAQAHLMLTEFDPDGELDTIAFDAGVQAGMASLMLALHRRDWLRPEGFLP